MDIIERKLSTYLYRFDCPSPHDLGEYHLKILSDDQTEAITQHLTNCPHCTRELTQLRNYLSELAPDLDYTFQERVKIWIARMLPNGPEGRMVTGPIPNFALRGETDGPLMFEAGNYQLTLEIQDDPANPGLKSILGLVIGGVDVLHQVELWQDGRSIVQTTIDDLGNFVFSGVKSGSYDLILSQKAAEIHVQAFNV
jgi:hypothetical protein